MSLVRPLTGEKCFYAPTVQWSRRPKAGRFVERDRAAAARPEARELARPPALHKPGSVWPTQAGTAVSKDVWMLGIGLGLMAGAAVDRGKG